MNEFQTVVTIISSLVSSVALPLLGVFLFYDSKKRKANAEARRAELDNLTVYADEWKALYEQRDKRVDELNVKIDQLYKEKEDDRQRIRELQEKNTTLALENTSLRIKECQVKGCKNRIPPSDY
ncbi:hypothetical protein [Bacteroides sp. An269]|uniref:hypothetical protein n=1 Tax=Bacteroides sp. An269 TaxID=1965613 RepID=UPI000B3A3E83|nr:hypothetical protein [Bacteroides sp. An269]OUO82426.1 hypothetical protein B5F71_04820 [Bacteroides sp. An269]